jgi:hypothetical protein
MTSPAIETSRSEEPAQVVTTRAYLSPEPQEHHRGRKRRRSPLPVSAIHLGAIAGATKKTLSGESATFRGRQRYRSTSLLTFSSAGTSRNPSSNTSIAISFRDDYSLSPSSPSRHLLRVPGAALKYHRRRRVSERPGRTRRRRSQSPSRSRSEGQDADALKRRRQQRTRSRSREHGVDDKIWDGLRKGIGSPLRMELVLRSPRIRVDKEE